MSSEQNEVKKPQIFPVLKEIKNSPQEEVTTRAKMRARAEVEKQVQELREKKAKERQDRLRKLRETGLQEGDIYGDDDIESKRSAQLYLTLSRPKTLIRKKSEHILPSNEKMADPSRAILADVPLIPARKRRGSLPQLNSTGVDLYQAFGAGGAASSIGIGGGIGSASFPSIENIENTELHQLNKDSENETQSQNETQNQNNKQDENQEPNYQSSTLGHSSEKNKNTSSNNSSTNLQVKNISPTRIPTVYDSIPNSDSSPTRNIRTLPKTSPRAPVKSPRRMRSPDPKFIPTSPRAYTTSIPTSPRALPNLPTSPRALPIPPTSPRKISTPSSDSKQPTLSSSSSGIMTSNSPSSFESMPVPSSPPTTQSLKKSPRSSLSSSSNQSNNNFQNAKGSRYPDLEISLPTKSQSSDLGSPSLRPVSGVSSLKTETITNRVNKAIDETLSKLGDIESSLSSLSASELIQLATRLRSSKRTLLLDTQSDSWVAPLTPRSNTLKLTSGINAIRGRRKTMEDTHVVYDDLSEISPQLKDFSFYAVYDGHSGTEAAIAARNQLLNYLIKDPEFEKGNYSKALENAFACTDDFIYHQSQEQGWKNGCTAVVVLIKGTELYLANLGDSEAILANRKEDDSYEPIVLSFKHSPALKSEKERIESVGGQVFNNRLFGSLAVSRSLGDCEYKKPISQVDFLSSEPYLNQITLTPQHDFLILACDGLYEKMTHQQALNFVAYLREEGKSPQEISILLAKEGFIQGSRDNITAIVVGFDWDMI